jgi:two-component system sensor histidine kinase/response regulator
VSSNRARVTIVDDMPTARELLGALLSVEPYDLFYATSGTQLLEDLEEIQPDVILLDVMMPDMDGFEVTQRLRADKTWGHVPVILVTALDSQQDLAQGLDAGADDFLPKPVNGVELRARVRSMLRIKRQFDALKETLKLREDLANMVVHDMRTPLTAILGFTELLRSGFISAEDTEDIEKLHRQVLRLNGFVNDILVQAKMENNKLILNPTPISVNGLLRTAQENHSVIAKSRGITLEMHWAEPDITISVDANLFQRVLDNLLSNALKFSPSHSTVSVLAKPTAASGVQIKVTDSGPGILPEDRERIFNKYEVASMRQLDSPVGLGLAFCKLVLDAHGGQISVEKGHPEGSIFTIEI